MHGTLKKDGERQAAALFAEQKPDTPDFMGRDWWLYKAMHDPAGKLARDNLAFCSSKYHESNTPVAI